MAGLKRTGGKILLARRLATAALLAALTWGVACSREGSGGHGKGAPGASSTVLEHTLRDLDGAPHLLKDALPDRAVLLWFTNFCSGCEQRFPFLERLARRNREHLAIFAISVLGDDRETPTRIRETRRPSFPLLLDPAEEVIGSLGLKHVPYACPRVNAVLVGRHGQVSWRGHLSAARDEDIEAAVAAATGIGSTTEPRKDGSL